MSYGRDFLGPYRLVRLVRAGNTCQIWEAIHDSERKRVALKVLQKEFIRDKVEINYLKHELLVGRPLEHERVIEIYEYNDSTDLPFLVLEYFKGKNVKQVMRAEPELIQEHLKKIIEQSAEGLHYFHESGWIHRDIKPDNYVVNDEGDVKLIDFALAQKPKSGLAAMFSFGGGKVQGTRSYMSPEQIRNKALTFRADIYSFGCMAYELLTGRLPFTGSNEHDLLLRHINSPVPSLLPYNSSLTSDLNELVMSMLAKDPEKRPRSMLRFLQMFREVRMYRSTRT